MSLEELLPEIRSLPQPDKLQLIRLLADDLMMGQAGSELRARVEYPVWSPYNATKAATALLEALNEDSESAHE